MIVFNGESFLHELLESIYDFAYEIVVVEGPDDWLAENLGRLGVRKVLNETQDYRFAIAVGQAGERRRHVVQLGTIQGPSFWAWRDVLLAAVQLHVPRTGVPKPVAGDVDSDPVQPRPLLQLTHPLRRIPHQRPVRAQEGVLGDLLGVMPVAGQGIAERIQPILVVVHHALEDVINTVHHSLLTRGGRPGLQGLGTGPCARLY